MAIHLYTGNDETPPQYSQGRAFCGWPRSVHRRHFTVDWHEVTCVNCLGRRDGLARFAVDQVKAEKEAKQP